MHIGRSPVEEERSDGNEKSASPRRVASRPRSARSLGLLSGSSNYRGETSDRQIDIVEGRRKGGRKRKGGRERKADDFFVVGSDGAAAAVG